VNPHAELEELANARAQVAALRQLVADVRHYADRAVETGDYQDAIQHIRSAVD
jgi:hypothetical protein